MARKDALSEARAALADLEVKLGEVRTKREVLLLSGDDRRLDAVDAELTALRRQSERIADRISLIEVEEKRAEAVRQAREKRGLIERIERKLNASNEAAIELQNFVELADKAFRKILALRSECAAAWPFTTNDQTALAFSAQAVRTLLQ
jgi:chromosome segregation ATPase